jgi:hypothetical protein
MNHYHMYDLGNGIGQVEFPNAARQRLLEYVRSIRHDPALLDDARLAALIEEWYDK